MYQRKRRSWPPTVASRRRATCSGRQVVSAWLLGTNVISELRRAHPKARVVAFVAAQPLETLFVSAVTFAEIRFGIEMVSDSIRRAELYDWLAHKVRPMFDQRVQYFPIQVWA